MRKMSNNSNKNINMMMMLLTALLHMTVKVELAVKEHALIFLVLLDVSE